MSVSSETLYLLAWLVLIVVLVILRGFTKNRYIRKRLGLSLLLLVAAFLLGLAAFLGSAADFKMGEAIPKLQHLLVALAVILAVVVLIFNKFSGTEVSGKFPSIVQDAVAVGGFLILAVFFAHEQLLAPSAVGALVIGLALQDTLGNFFAGLALQVEKPFHVGNWVRVAQLEGRVQEVNWRATTIRTKAGHFCVIPNHVISRDTIVNFSHPSNTLRLEIVIGFGYEAPPNKVKRVVLDTLSDIPEALKDPEPEVLLKGYADFSIDYRCRFWINDFRRSEQILDRFTTLLYYRLDRAALKIPFPIRDVRMQQEEKGAVREEETGTRRLAFLSGMDLFSDLQREDLEQIAGHLESITYASGEPIVRQGQEGDSMFFIRSGQVRIVLEKAGVETQIATLHSGQYFGEMALLTGETRSASAYAVSDVQAYALRKEPFREVLHRQPAIAEKISQVIAERKREQEMKGKELEARRVDTEELSKSLLRRIRSFFGL